MGSTTRARRLGAGAALLVVLAGCSGSGAAATPAPATMGPTAAPPQSATPAAADMTPAPPPTATAAAVKVTREVAYETASDVLEPGVLDVYVPPSGGPWPVVVMFHGTPTAVSRDSLAEHARRVAGLGFVVFDADWGHPSGDVMSSDPYAYVTASGTQAACAIAFARAKAPDYGGDPSKLLVFGYSGGANVGSVVAFGDIQPSTGCGTDGKTGPIDSLITFEGDFLAAPELDPVLKAEPRWFDLYTPWAHLADKPTLPVSMLLSEQPGPTVEAPFTKADLPGFLALRDKGGTLARLMKQTGAIDDRIFSVADEQRVLYEALREQGNPVSLDIMPGSTHIYASEEGWKVLLAAFEKARVGT